MELSPHAVSTANFKTVKKGYDPDAVRAFLSQVAGSLESSQQQATAMEARARAAIAKLQDLSTTSASPTVSVGPAEAETISRTLLLAQRTADLTVAEATAEAESITAQAAAEAARSLEDAQAMATKLLDEARLEARRAKDDEVHKADNEVQALLARRDFLLADVDQLELHVVAQRDRLREAAAALVDLVERVPGGLGDQRRPLLSASGDSGEQSTESTESTESPFDPVATGLVDDQLELDDVNVDPTPLSDVRVGGPRSGADELQ